MELPLHSLKITVSGLAKRLASVLSGVEYAFTRPSDREFLYVGADAGNAQDEVTDV